MLLPPNHPNKSFTRKTKLKKKRVNNKGLPDKVVKLAQKLQESIDRLSSSEDVSTQSEDGDNDEIVETNEENDVPITLESPVLEETGIKIKKAHKNYTNNIQQFEDLNKLDAYMRTVCLKFKKTHNNQVNCSSCNSNHDRHKMTQIYFICQCADKECNLGWRAINCEKSESIWQLFQSGSLHDIPEDYRKNLRAEGKAIPKPCGIALFIKKIFTRWIKRDDMMTANILPFIDTFCVLKRCFFTF